MRNGKTEDSNRRYELNISEGHISLQLYEERTNKATTAILSFFVIAIWAILIGSFVYIAASGEGIPFGFVITCVVGIMTSVYLLRLLLWNKFGKEVFLITKDKFVSYNDYKFFRDNYHSMPFSLLRFYIVENRHELVGAPKKIYAKYVDSYHQIAFVDGKDLQIVSKNVLPIEEIVQIRQAIDSWS